MYPLNLQRHFDLGAWCGPSLWNTGLNRTQSLCQLPDASYPNNDILWGQFMHNSSPQARAIHSTSFSPIIFGSYVRLSGHIWGVSLEKPHPCWLVALRSRGFISPIGQTWALGRSQRPRGKELPARLLWELGLQGHWMWVQGPLLHSRFHRPVLEFPPPPLDPHFWPSFFSEKGSLPLTLSQCFGKLPATPAPDSDSPSCTDLPGQWDHIHLQAFLPRSAYGGRAMHLQKCFLL